MCFRVVTCATEDFKDSICQTLWLDVHSLHLAFPSFTFLARGASHSLNSCFPFSLLHRMHCQNPRRDLVVHLRHLRVSSSPLTPSHPYTLTPLQSYTLTPSHPYTITPPQPYTPATLHPHTKDVKRVPASIRYECLCVRFLIACAKMPRMRRCHDAESARVPRVLRVLRVLRC